VTRLLVDETPVEVDVIASDRFSSKVDVLVDDEEDVVVVIEPIALLDVSTLTLSVTADEVGVGVDDDGGDVVVELVVDNVFKKQNGFDKQKQYIFVKLK